MDTTMYRRRGAGQGSRTAGKRRPAGLSARERRRLVQLAASIFIFLLVFFGRGVFPEQMAALGEVLDSDLDLKEAVSALSRAVSEGEEDLTALERFAAALRGGAEGVVEDKCEPTLEPPSFPTFVRRMEEPGFEARHQLNEPSPDPVQEPEEGTSAEENELVVTAVAQLYNEAGEPLPERVSYEYYNLGLEETAVPVMGSVTSGFGFRDHPVNGEYSFHTAVDIGVETGSEICSFADGTVRYIGENEVFGLYVKVDHDNGVSTFYAHCDELLVSKGDIVTCGQVIALAGETGNATGPHLHFSLEKDGIRLDPEYYLEL